ncbi:IS3 family transposase [Persicobacter diffluens]|uniref:Integrase n=1 Tax=Persicobacter diffluens TaxID=981 RepID=A0AAN4W0Z7_9BACT|nr:integrase [Persicobacter diffluens]GJM64039.1 integrase [Persicobacter diffluens]
MKQRYPAVGLNRITACFGYTRQAWYQHEDVLMSHYEMEKVVVEQVKRKRKKLKLRKLGTRKLYHVLNEELKELGIYIGRDKLFTILRENNLLIKKKRNRAITTNSNHRFKKYKNLIQGTTPTRPDEQYAADITYIKLLGPEDFCYLHLITDLYSHKIVGWHLSRSLAAKESRKALKMALKQRKNKNLPLIHHSDRGVQYCSNKYVQDLRNAGVSISMTESYDPYQNAAAERVNGILKDELDLGARFMSFEEAFAWTSDAIEVYNFNRPHLSINMLTPDQAHQMSGPIKKLWKNYYQLKLKNRESNKPLEKRRKKRFDGEFMPSK